MALSSLRTIDAGEVRLAAEVRTTADALEAALRAGLDPEAALDRGVLPIDAGEMLVMPAAVGEHATVKLLTIGGTPRIQGVMVVFDAHDLSLVALIDGVAVTEVRTAAVSLVAARRMVRDERIDDLVVFGRGPQGQAHVEALKAEFAVGSVTVLHSGSTPAEVRAAVAAADMICCATTAREPLFPGDLVSDSASVIAVGSHEPDARELDGQLVARSAVAVESRRAATTEAGDLIMAEVESDRMVTLADLVVDNGSLADDRPRLFKSVGMSWEDAVVANVILAATPRAAEVPT